MFVGAILEQFEELCDEIYDCDEIVFICVFMSATSHYVELTIVVD